jgi:hypothetical protein
MTANRYIVIEELSAEDFQNSINSVAQQGYVLHSYKHTAVDKDRIYTRHHYSAVMEVEPIPFDAMAFQKVNRLTNVNN